MPFLMESTTTIRPLNYTLRECLSSSSKSEVYAAVRNTDGLAVVAKLESASHRPRGVSKLRREYELLRKVEGDGIVKALDLDESGQPALLILEHLPGVPLRRYLHERSLSLDRFLSVAVQAARALERVHAARVLHKDLKPSNLLVEPETGKTWLIDFGLAVEVGEASRTRPALEGTPLYLAPEQTGRMNRSVDVRSDLYGLGATFYELLTGRPPFLGEDALELIHAHLAKTPTPPAELDPEIPPTLSRLVVKLLEKEPEQRYQSAKALAADLAELQRELREEGQIGDDLKLGQAEVPTRPLFSKRLYGRQREVGELHSAYRRVERWASELFLISGPSGVGKSALVEELREVVVASGGHLVQGKFDLYRRETPYAGFIAAFESLVQQILTTNQEQLEQWQNELADEMGGIGQVMVQLVPDLGIVLPDAPAVPQLRPKETLQRLALAVERFVRACATPEHPLVLFLDDLQWADGGSLYLLERLLSSSRTEVARALLLVGTYRDTELDPDHPLPRLLGRLRDQRVVAESVTLGPLSLESSSEMLAEALGRPVEATLALAESVRLKTANNPLLIQQFILHMHEQGKIRFEAGTGWIWDEGAISAADAPEDAVGFLTAKIESLDPEVQEVLKFASCMGDEFDAELLTELSHLGPGPNDPLAASHRAKIEASLYVLSDEGLIAPCRQGFRFVHDRIRETGQSLWSDQERAQLHYDTGRRLLARAGSQRPTQRLFEIVDHLNRGASCIPDRERIETMELNLLASRQALAVGATSTAVGHLAAGRGSVRPEDWDEHRALAVDLYLDSVEALLHVDAFAAARDLLDEFEARPLCALEEARATAKRILLHALTRSPRKTADLALAALRRLGFRWSIHPSRLRLWFETRRTDWALRHCESEDCFAPTMPPDEQAQAARVILERAHATVSRASSRLLLLLICTSLRTIPKWGFVVAPGHSGVWLGPLLIAFAVYRRCFVSGTRMVHRYVRAGLLWTEKTGDPAAMQRAQFQVQALINPWFEPRRSSIEPLGRVAEALRELGDLEWSNYAEALSANLQAFSGCALEEVETALQAVLRRFSTSRYDRIGSLALLGNETDGPLDEELAKTEAQYLELGEKPFPAHATLWMLVLVVYGRHPQAFAQSQRSRGRIFEVSAEMTHVVDYCFLRALAAAALASGARGAGRRRYRRIVRRNYRRVARWARHGPDFRPMVHFLQAERLRLGKRFEKALSLYRKAARESADQGSRHYAALAHEAAARLLLELQRPAQAAQEIRWAFTLYKHWGAKGKVAQLLREHESLLISHRPKAAPALRSSRPIDETISSQDNLTDTHSHLEVTARSVAPDGDEEGLDQVLERLMRAAIENAGARRALLLLVHTQDLCLEAEGTLEGAWSHPSLPLSQCGERLAVTLVRYVERTHKTVVLANATTDSLFANDPYVLAQASKSILCVPIVRESRLVGALYLENDLATDVFAEERGHVLGLLSTAWTYARMRLLRDRVPHLA